MTIDVGRSGIALGKVVPGRAHDEGAVVVSQGRAKPGRRRSSGTGDSLLLTPPPLFVMKDVDGFVRGIIVRAGVSYQGHVSIDVYCRSEISIRRDVTTEKPLLFDPMSVNKTVDRGDARGGTIFPVVLISNEHRIAVE